MEAQASTSEAANGSSRVNGHSKINGDADDNGISLAELEAELPRVEFEQVELSELLSRFVQAVYAELSEMAETMPSMSDGARKRTIADFCVKTKKQVAKLYAVMKWSRDAGDVQKAMNITAFLMDQNTQFENAVNALQSVKESLAPARMRNHDLLTSLDVLTTGTYHGLPSRIKKFVIPEPPLTDAEIEATLRELEHLAHYRLCTSEIVPVEMSSYKISRGRVVFTCSKLFEVSICLRGALPDDGWFFVNVEFLINVAGDVTASQDFPRIPPGALKQFIAEEADRRLSMYLPPPPPDPLPEGYIPPERPKIPHNSVDAPLIRLYNFLQMMSFSYQLEILFFQASRLLALGWAEYLRIELSRDRKVLTASYWIRKPQRGNLPANTRPIPLLGGSLTISILVKPPVKFQAPSRSALDRVLTELEEKSKFGSDRRPSDQIEDVSLQVKWEPAKGALGVNLTPQDAVLAESELAVDADNLDFESLLLKVIRKHAHGILKSFQTQLLDNARRIFSKPSDVLLVPEAPEMALRIHLTAEEVVTVTIDSRTGRLTLKDIGDLTAAGRGPRFSMVSDKINETPNMMVEAIVRLRYNTILDATEHKANYLGLQNFRQKNLRREEYFKFGPSARAFLFIQLANFETHYLVLVIAEDGYKYALTCMRPVAETPHTVLVMDDIGWLDVARISGANRNGLEANLNDLATAAFIGDASMNGEGNSSFSLDTSLLRELYAYCCARVSHLIVEQQLKQLKFSYYHVAPSTRHIPTELGISNAYSPLASIIPALCVKSKDILSGSEGADAAYENVRIIPLDWWLEAGTRVVTCVKLKHVQAAVGKTIEPSQRLIRPSQSILYDTQEGMISVLSPNVQECVSHFLMEWRKVSKMVVIAREVSQLADKHKWTDVQLQSFDLQTAEFTYYSDYAISISCRAETQPSSKSIYSLEFSRISAPSRLSQSIASTPANNMEMDPMTNPHTEIVSWVSKLLSSTDLAIGVRNLVILLRLSLPVVLELDSLCDRWLSEGEEEAGAVDWFPKGVAWWRFLLGDMRHALDFRIRADRLLEIQDASYNHFAVSAWDKTEKYDPLADSPYRLQRIPSFETVCRETVLHADIKVISFDRGILCSCDAPHPSIRGTIRDIVHRSRDALRKAATASSAPTTTASAEASSSVIK
ncbi:MED14-domain-containing protein [Sistotremastrum suecicum HHB10207 ss-3]|uniref:Mediator of RNA polymerase II transcription subunit 14 n=1 Tax=Sistotremastrum suecicum HHB10207 ss-3 TaxID=1314776 RepID=A0A166FMW9_9AGAM|nr:MED14-domain-containing protein [Sistotremastrum suecicum HHB10207 ss-3]